MEHVRLIETKGHPMVYATGFMPQGNQPRSSMVTTTCSRPIRWMNGFRAVRATERDGNIYARGAVDDKGQVMAQVKALESLLVATGKLPSMCA